MKRFLMLATAFSGALQLSSAAPVCGKGTLSSYVALGSGGCMVGSDILFNFQVLGGTAGASEIPAASVLLSPLTGGSSFGLEAVTDVTASAGNIQETLFTYQVSGGAYTATSIALSGSSETGDGAVTGLQNYCAGGSFGMDGLSGCTGLAGALAAIDGAQNQDFNAFPTVSLVSVTNDLTFDGGIAGSATGGTFENRFTTASTATPEPFTFFLTGIGLALAAGRCLISTRSGPCSK